VSLVKSFDIFETLVSRPFAPAHRLFLLVATVAERTHGLSIDPATFEAGRVLAEKRVRQRSDKAEATIEDIYRECRSILKLSKDDVDVLVSCETRLEIELCRPIQTGLGLLERARRQGHRVVFISDTYLPRSAVHKILVRNGCWKEGDRLYVSCEVGATKRSGELFRHVLETESICASQMVHVGNDARSDVKIPGRLGIGTEPFLQGNLTARENHLATAKHCDALLPGLLAGCSRLARLDGVGKTAQHQRLREIAAHAAGPFLTGFVLWVLQTAKAKGLKRLYFISRDGFLLLKLAKALASSVDPSLELRYLYGSRQAWHFPASRGKGFERAYWLWEWTTSYSVATVLGRVGLTPEAVGTHLQGAGLPSEVWNCPMTRENEAKLKRVFSEPEFKNVLSGEAEKQRNLLVAYLRQEGLFSDVAYAIVDVGWKGNLQDSLGTILEEEGRRRPVSGFYVGLNYRGPLREKGERKTYLFDLRDDPRWRLPIPQLQSCIETFCSANHGSTIGYRVQGGSIVPVLQRWQTQPLETWGLEELQTVATAYAAELARVLSWFNKITIDPLLAARSLAFTWSNPTLEEAECLGSFPFIEDQAGIGARPLARPLPWQHFARIGKSRYFKAYRVIWLEGCLRLTPEPRSSLLRFANAVKNAGGMALSRRVLQIGSLLKSLDGDIYRDR
jgi:predicted HAD superfamily hydrolase